MTTASPAPQAARSPTATRSSPRSSTSRRRCSFDAPSKDDALSFDRVAFELRRDTFEELLAPGLSSEQRLHAQEMNGTRATCPCCGYPMLDGRAGYDICPLCDWEDDG